MTAKKTEVQPAPMQLGCVWNDFDATVRSGAHAGTGLDGRLVLAQFRDTRDVYGTLFTREGDPVAVSGTRSDDTISLRFESALGRIDGTGPIAGANRFCMEDLTGDLTGPAEGDAGDWLGAGLIDYDLDEYEGSQEPPTAVSPTGEFTSNDSVSPSCYERVLANGTTRITCSTVNGSGGNVTTTTCTTDYPPNGGKPTQKCSTISGSRPGIEQLQE